MIGDRWTLISLGEQARTFRHPTTGNRGTLIYDVLASPEVLTHEYVLVSRAAFEGMVDALAADNGTAAPVPGFALQMGRPDESARAVTEAADRLVIAAERFDSRQPRRDDELSHVLRAWQEASFRALRTSPPVEDPSYHPVD